MEHSMNGKIEHEYILSTENSVLTATTGNLEIICVLLCV